MTDPIDRLNRAQVARIAARDALAAADLECARAARAVCEDEEAVRLRKAEQHAAAYREIRDLFEWVTKENHGVGLVVWRRVLDAWGRVEQAGQR